MLGVLWSLLFAVVSFVYVLFRRAFKRLARKIVGTHEIVRAAAARDLLWLSTTGERGMCRALDHVQSIPGNRQQSARRRG